MPGAKKESSNGGVHAGAGVYPSDRIRNFQNQKKEERGPIMRMMESENLFTDMYAMREHYYAEDKDRAIKAAQEDVSRAITQEDYPIHLRYLLFKLTNYCNSDCAYCSHAVNRAIPEKKHVISHELAIKTIEDAAKMGVQAISMSGGEPLLRKDIVSLIKKVVDCKMIPVLLTNGLLLDRCWDELGAAGLRYIVISVDSVNREVYERQRGASFELAMKGIEAARKLRDKYGYAEIHVSAVLTKDNYEDFMDLVAYMRDRDIKVQVIPYHKRQNDAENLTIKEADKIKELTSRLIEIKKESKTIANSVGFLQHLPDYFINGKTLPDHFACKVGYTNLCIDAYMDVKPCWSCRFEPIGNLSEKSLPEMWSSDKLVEYRKRMLRCDCEGCWYLCTSEICMMLDAHDGA